MPKDIEKIHRLVARHGIDGFQDGQVASEEQCELCKAAGFVKKELGPEDTAVDLPFLWRNS
jgi:hypothetical protein